MRVDLGEVAERLRAAGCVYAEEEADLLITQAGPDGDLESLVARRVGGEPLEHVLGWVDFAGVRVSLNPGVFIPRRRTELLVQAAIDAGRAAGLTEPVVVDLCCGSGAVGAAVAHQLGGRLYAVDIDEAAVQCARDNVPADSEVFVGDLYQPLPRDLAGAVDLLVVNAPYVPTAELSLMPRDLRAHELAVAHDGGTDGVDVQRRVAAEAPAWIRPGGHLLTETSRRQADTVAEVFAAAGLEPAIRRSDELGATVVLGQLPG